MKKLSLFKTLAVFLVMTTISACGETGDYRTVSFDANTSYQTNNVLPQSIKVGGKVKKPSVTITEDNPDNYKVYAWYKEKSLQTQWNFKKDVVEKSMTLYAEWKKVYTVNYFVGDDIAPMNTVNVFEGETIKEHADYCAGYSYLGSYTDKAYTIPFDYSQGITSNLDIYMKKSEGIDLYEGNPAGGLYENLEIYQSTDRSSTPEVPEVGNISRTENRDAIFIDFGYSPDVADPYIELSLNLDISKSQVLHFVMKYFGKAEKLYFYFTTLLDNQNFIYSVTGKNYNENFTASYYFSDNEKEMSEEDEYIDIAVDLASLSYYNGYSVWGTSPYLGKIRIQSVYQSTSKDDHSNAMLLKRIYGTNEGYENGVITEDSDNIKNILKDDSTLPSQEEISTGFIFPKNKELVSSSSTAATYSKNDGLLMHFENEIEMRKQDNKTQSVTIKLPTNSQGDVIGDKQVSLETYQNMYVTLRNYGYGDSLRVIIENDYGGKTFTTLKLDRRALKEKTYSINLSREALMIHTLVSITFEYEAVGVDNAILVSNIYFDITKPFDIPGISFDDREIFGLTTSEGSIDISHSKSYAATEFDVKENNSVATSTKTDIKFTNTGYYNLTLAYSRSKNSLVEGVYVSFKVNGSYSKEYFIETPEITNSTATIRIDSEDFGSISNIKFRFKGTGIIRFVALRFEVDDLYCFDLSHDMTPYAYSDWASGMTYSYNEALSASTLVPDPSQAQTSISFYLGIGNSWYGHNAYNCQNLLLLGKTRIAIVYHNDEAATPLQMIPSYTKSIDSNPDSETTYARDLFTLSLRGEMAAFEWDVVYINIPREYTNAYLGKLTFRNLTSAVSFRMVAVI